MKDAPRLIPATPALLRGYTGPIVDTRYSAKGISVLVLEAYEPDIATVRVYGDLPGVSEWEVRIQYLAFDPMIASVRDALIRSLELPDWIRETRSRSSPPSLVIEGADGARAVHAYFGGSLASPRGLEPWESAGILASQADAAPHWSICEVWRPAESDHPADNRDTRWIKITPGYDNGIRVFGTVDQMLRAGRALRMDTDTLILPWRGGARRWTREAQL